MDPRPDQSEPDDPRLRDVTRDDVSIFFEHQLDAEANWLAAFTVEDPTDEDSFIERWARILADPTVVKQTVLVGGEVAGHVVSFERSGEREVSYWLGRGYWGRGLATRALAGFLQAHEPRPLYARVAKDHHASARVLQKCGFERSRQESGFANARGAVIEETVFVLGDGCGRAGD